MTIARAQFRCCLCLSLLAGLVLASCTQIPSVKAFPPYAAAEPPRLLPLDDLLAKAEAPLATEERGADLNSRAARLKARAALMRGPVLQPSTRARLADAVEAGRA